jgi:DNA-binding response OmpR family regulator
MPKSRILVVDDEEDVRVFLKKRLERNNFKVSTASTGGECLDAIGEFNPDLVLLDIVMPHMDGYEVIRKIKNDPKTKDIPILMHSVRKETNSIFKSMELGSIDYVIKPVNFETLLRVIKRYV